ncbi:MAG: helix-turn-helix transcriptional regulator [Acidobacteria bacterium]|nr:helix-turn-helix transcriptional regulator [Acidobacteriota bacterium]
MSDRRKILMGNPRPRPLRLASKLREIREALELSQTQMLVRLGLDGSMHYGRISQYENDEREPTLLTLLAYAHVAGVHLEDIVDDHLDLPARLPGKIRYRGRRTRGTRK